MAWHYGCGIMRRTPSKKYGHEVRVLTKAYRHRAYARYWLSDRESGKREGRDAIDEPSCLPLYGRRREGMPVSGVSHNLKVVITGRLAVDVINALSYAQIGGKISREAADEIMKQMAECCIWPPTFQANQWRPDSYTQLVGLKESATEFLVPHGADQGLREMNERLQTQTLSTALALAIPPARLGIESEPPTTYGSLLPGARP
jgi:hypothetical protein